MHFGKNNERQYVMDIGKESPPHIIEKTLGTLDSLKDVLD